MPTLDDAPTIAPIAAEDIAGSDLVQVFSAALRKPKVTSITSLVSAITRLLNYLGFSTSDVNAGATGNYTATAFTVTSRVTVFSGTTVGTNKINLPAANGTIRNVSILNVSATTGAVNSIIAAGTDKIVTGQNGVAGAATIATQAIGTSVQLISDGVSKWYHISNDA
jgi:hypothetical protein